MNKRISAALAALVMTASVFTGCIAAKPEEPVSETTVAEGEKVVLTVGGAWTDCKAIDVTAAAFSEKYPNCSIVYEYLQDFETAIEKRLSGDEQVDLFFAENIQANSSLLPYALDFNSVEKIDLSNTFDGLIENFTFREENVEKAKIYSIPVGAEMRGMYVNTTLLNSVGLEIPQNRKQLMEACEVLKEKGYIPFHGNPGSFSQTLLYPWICNLIAHAANPQETYDKVNNCEAGVSEIFREPFAFLYSLVENGYYDYKKAQTDLDLFNDTTDEDYARYFLNIKKEGDDWAKADDLGQIAFMPSPLSLQRIIDKTKEDYHSEIDYEFVLAPVSEENGGFAYLSPARGIAVNKNSANLDKCIDFINFLFTPENNNTFAEEFYVIPNTKEAFSYIKNSYDVPENHISELGQVTFSYGFYDIMLGALVDASKANNPKYMIDNGDGTYSLYPLDHYMQTLEDGFKNQ